MYMKKFELWLDESGDFLKNDLDLSNNPSLVGGVLIGDGAITADELKRLYVSKSGTDIIHLNEMKENVGVFVKDVLSNLKDKIEAFVIFQNSERLLNINEDDTYLNVLSQGIIKLYEELTIKYGDIELEVLIAVRLANKLNYSEIINKDEYTRYVKKKVLYEDLSGIIDERRLTLSFGSARRDQKLMLSDIVCNTYLTINSRKYSGYKEDIQEIIQEKIYKFSLTERLADTLLKKYVLEENFCNATLLVLTSKSLKSDHERRKVILDRLTSLDSARINLHLDNIINYLNCLVLDQKFDAAKEYLTSIENYLQKELEQRGVDKKLGNAYYKFIFDTKLLLLTIYTHEGDILNSERIISECNDNINSYIKNFENMNQYFIFKIREGVHRQNIFDFSGSELEMEKVITTLNDILDVMPMVKGFDAIGENIKSDLLMKARGTRLLANILRIKQVEKAKFEEFIEALRDESNKIIEGFESDKDKSMQYQFRSNLECEAGNYEAAVEYLIKSMGQNCDNIKGLAKEAINSSSPYPLMHYTKIMSEASIDKNVLAKELYMAMVNERFESSKWFNLEIEDCNYPSMVTYWRMGNYLIEDNSIVAALKYIDKAIAIGNKHSKNLTIRGINLGIMASKLLALKSGIGRKIKENEFITFQKSFIREIEDFTAIDLPKEMAEHFSDFVNMRLTQEEDSIRKLIRKITF